MAEYITVAELDAYAAEYGLTFAGTPTDGDKETAIARGRIVLDGMAWPGRRTDGRQQSNQWPRLYAYDRDGFVIDSQTVPDEIKLANALLAIIETDNPGSLTPSVTLNDLVKAEKVGELSVTYRDGPSAFGAQPIVTRVQAVLRPLIGSRGLELVRA